MYTAPGSSSGHVTLSGKPRCLNPRGMSHQHHQFCAFVLSPLPNRWAALYQVPPFHPSLLLLGMFPIGTFHTNLSSVLCFLSTVSTFFITHFLLIFRKSHWKGHNAIRTQKHTQCKLGEQAGRQQRHPGSKAASRDARRFPHACRSGARGLPAPSMGNKPEHSLISPVSSLL